jgi:4-amino-4-deoxy-L-arabinose transferase-like glycosyltransferase
VTTTNSRTAEPGVDRPVLARALHPFAARPVAVVVAVLAGLLTAVSNRYGYHRDELYFLVAGDHPAWGYVDQPPITPLLARLSTAVFGDTLMGLRVVATLLACAAVVVVALLARELGATRRAQVVAASCAAASGFVLATGHMLVTASVDMVAWLVVSLFVLRLLRTGDRRWYLAVGAAVGVGMLNKWLIALLVVGLLAGLLAAGPRRALWTWWLPAGAAVAVLVALPNLWWGAAHGWPQFAVAAMISDDVGVENRVMFFPLQILQLSPLFVPVWVAGFVRLWRDPEIRWARGFTAAYGFFVVLMLVTGGKSYYLMPLLLVAIAAGAMPVTQWVSATGRRVAVAVTAFVLAVAISVVAALPVLPSRVAVHLAELNNEQVEQLGWPEFVALVARAWDRIPPGDRDRAVILAQSYGETAAVDRFGPDHELPPAYSGHMSFADWGAPPDTATGPVVLVHPAPGRVTGLLTGCETVTVVGDELPMNNELSENVIQLCDGPARPWSELWPRLRHLN